MASVALFVLGQFVPSRKCASTTETVFAFIASLLTRSAALWFDTWFILTTCMHYVDALASPIDMKITDLNQLWFFALLLFTGLASAAPFIAVILTISGIAQILLLFQLIVRVHRNEFCVWGREIPTQKLT